VSSVSDDGGIARFSVRLVAEASSVCG